MQHIDIVTFVLPRKDEKPNDINGCIVKSDRLLDELIISEAS